MTITQCPDCYRLFSWASAGGGVPGGKEREEVNCPLCGFLVHSEMTSAVFLTSTLAPEDECRELAQRLKAAASMAIEEPTRREIVSLLKEARRHIEMRPGNGAQHGDIGRIDDVLKKLDRTR